MDSPITTHLRDALSDLDAVLHAASADEQLTDKERGELLGLAALSHTVAKSAERVWQRALCRMTPDGGMVPFSAEELGYDPVMVARMGAAEGF